MIVLIGFMGAGKTTVGRLLANRLGLPFVDADVVIEEREGRSIRSIFEDEGEPTFREIERRTVAELLAGEDAVLALGGGAVEDAGTREALRGRRVAYLQVDLDQALSRVGGDDERPVLRSPELAERYGKRLDQYADVATVTVDTGAQPAEDVVEEIARHLSA